MPGHPASEPRRPHGAHSGLRCSLGQAGPFRLAHRSMKSGLILEFTAGWTAQAAPAPQAAARSDTAPAQHAPARPFCFWSWRHGFRTATVTMYFSIAPTSRVSISRRKHSSEGTRASYLLETAQQHFEWTCVGIRRQFIYSIQIVQTLVRRAKLRADFSTSIPQAVRF